MYDMVFGSLLHFSPIYPENGTQSSKTRSTWWYLAPATTISGKSSTITLNIYFKQTLHPYSRRITSRNAVSSSRSWTMKDSDRKMKVELFMNLFIPKRDWWMIWLREKLNIERVLVVSDSLLTLLGDFYDINFSRWLWIYF